MHRNIEIFLLIIMLQSVNLFAEWQGSWLTFTTKDGLSDNWVRTIVTDQDGALWLGTDEGICKYENGIWTIVPLNNTLIRPSIIYRGYRDSSGALWFGTFGSGVIRYDGFWDTFHSGNSGLPNDTVMTIIEDHDGAIWFGTFGGGACRFKEGIWQTYDANNNGLASNHILSILEDRDGAMWFGTYRSGVFRCMNQNWEHFNSENGGLISYEVRDIMQSSDGSIWFGIWGSVEAPHSSGINCYQDGTWKTFMPFRSELTGQGIFKIYEDNEGTLWFGTGTDGVYQYSGGVWKVFNTSNSGIPAYFVSSIYQDDQGILWFGTNGGVCQYEEKVWEMISSSEGARPSWLMEIYEDRQGTIWYSKEGFLTCCKDGQCKTYTTYNSGLAENDVSCIFEDSRGAMWFGLCTQGLNRYKNGQWETFNRDNSGLAGYNVNMIIEDHQGIIWIATTEKSFRDSGGVSCYLGNIDGVSEENRWQNYNVSNSGIVSDSIKVILEDSPGSFWFGSVDRGVSHFINGNWITYNTSNSGLVHNSIHSIIKDREGAIWIGTWGGKEDYGGVNRYKDGHWETYTSSNSGLASPYILEIMEDSRGVLWFATNLGISRLENGLWSTLNTENSGLPSNIVLALREDRHGDFWFGCEGGGVIKYYGDDVPPVIRITSTPGKLVGNSTPVFTFQAKDTQTPHNEIMYSFAVANPLVQTDPDYSLFSYLTFGESTPLLTGEYVFYARARDIMGNISQPVTYSFRVDIIPPTVIIDSPKPESIIHGMVPVIGSVFDDSPIHDFASYNLQYRKNDPSEGDHDWKTIVYQNQQEIRSDTLGMWDTSGLRGSCQLKLFAIDSLGHESDDIVSLSIVDKTGKIYRNQGGRIDSNTGIQVYFPPNAFKEDQIVQIVQVPQENNSIIIFDVLPADVEMLKPVTLIISYDDSLLNEQISVSKLAIYHFDRTQDQWCYTGGTLDSDDHTICVSVNQLGRYGIFEITENSLLLSLTDIDCQPRVFSPKGGGYDTRTAISFPLQKATDVTVKIYNLSGRLKKCVTQNRFMNPGMNVVHWDGRDENGAVVPGGLYIVTVQAGGKLMKKTVSVVNR